MSSYYRRHARIFQVAGLLYLLPCSYNPKTDQFEQQLTNKLAFVFGIITTIPCWYFDLKFMTAFYLENISPIMAIVGCIEIALYVSIVSCTMLNTFVRRKRYTRLLNVLFHADWLLDRYENLETEFDNRRHFVAFMVAVITMVCCNMFYHRDMNVRLMSLSVAMKIFGICYLTVVHRICVGAIGVRMKQLRAFCQLHQMRHHAQEQTVRYFIERFEHYATQLQQIDYCFSFPLTMIILLVLIEMVYLLFDVFTILELGRPAIMENLEIDYVQWALRQLWQTIYGAVVLVTVTGCQNTCDQLHQTAQLVQHLHDEQNRNSRMAKRIQRFLLHNLDRKTTFSACGMFDIDYAMLYMVFSSIFTYMVILIHKADQFETNFKSSLVIFVINLTLASLHMCFDWHQIWNGERAHTSRIFHFLFLLHIVTFPMTIVYMLLLSFTKRVRIAKLYNELFTDRSWRFFGERTSGWYVSCLWLGRFTTAVIIGGAFYLFVLILTGNEQITQFPLTVTILEAIRLYVTLISILIYVVCVLAIKMRFKQIQERVQRFGASMNTCRQWNIFLHHYDVGVSMVNEINDNFSVLLLMILVEVQVQLTNQFYILYCSMQLGMAPAVSKMMMWHTQFWESLFLLILLLVGYACDSCHDQVRWKRLYIRCHRLKMVDCDVGALYFKYISCAIQQEHFIQLQETARLGGWYGIIWVAVETQADAEWQQ
uniref:Gustatory receptor n=1 Tax=Anopheles culicifacies TaxID=139723 RepID=A0A182MTB4_9DIPT